MRNKSIFSGIKELDALQFHDDDFTWGVYEVKGGAWIRIGTLLKIKGESNQHLYERGKKLQHEEDTDA